MKKVFIISSSYIPFFQVSYYKVTSPCLSIMAFDIIMTTAAKQGLFHRRL